MMQYIAIQEHEPDYLEYESRQTSVYFATIIMFGLAFFFVSLRFYARSRLNNFRGKDDYWILAAMITSTGDFGMKIALLQYGLGRHEWNLSVYEANKNIQLIYAVQALYPVSLCLAKISILSFYLRIFPFETFRLICHGTRIFVAAFMIATSLAMLLACTPIQYGWSLTAADHCVDKSHIQYAASSLNLATDVFILLLPINYLWAMSINKRKKIGVIVLFSLGFITCVTSAIRISTITVFYKSGDRSWSGSLISICSAIECNLAISAASIPACQPVIKIFLRKLLPEKFFSDGSASRETSDQTVAQKNWPFSSRGDTADGQELSAWHDAGVKLTDDQSYGKEFSV